MNKLKCDSEPAFVLHSYPFKETSLIVEAFTKSHGRVALVARGARRPHSAMKLSSLQPFLLSWFGKTELRTLHKAEWQGGQPLLQKTALICGLYMNELLLKLLARDDPHENLFQRYRETLQALGNAGDHAGILRRFEVSLLGELGYAPLFDREAESGNPVQPELVYNYLIEKGPVPASQSDNLRLNGKTLLDMALNDYSDPATIQQSKALMRFLINHYLGAEPLHTRRLFQELQ